MRLCHIAEPRRGRGSRPQCPAGTTLESLIGGKEAGGVRARAHGGRPSADRIEIVRPGASCLGEAYTLAGRLSEAIRLLEEAVERGPALGFVAGLPKSLTALGEAYLAARRVADAGRTVGRALDTARAGRQRGLTAEALGALAAVHASPGGAGGVAAAARRMLGEMGMAHWLERADAVSGAAR
jgi:tetratricopeptide (TPR) repeat protein